MLGFTDLHMPEIPPLRRPTEEETPAAMDEAENDFTVQMHIIKEHQQAAKAGLDEALTIITKAIRSHWSTGGGTRLRQIVWSIWNGETLIGLYDVFGGLARAVAKLVEAQLVGALDSDDYLRRVLTESGEFARYDEAAEDTPEGEEVIYPPMPVSPERLRKLADAAEGIKARYESEAQAGDTRLSRQEITHA